MEVAFIPGRILQYVCPDTARQYSLNILLSHIIIIVVAYSCKSRLPAMIDLVPHGCILKEVAGIRCPGCGITRACVEITMFNFGAAYALNPAAFAIAGCCLLQVPLRLFALLYVNSHAAVTCISSMVSNAALGFLLFHWICRMKAG
jgi:hypothetical protein